MSMSTDFDLNNADADDSKIVTVVIKTEARYDRLSLAQFMLMFTFFFQWHDMLAMTLVRMHRHMKRKGGVLQVRMPQSAAKLLRQAIEDFRPVITPYTLESIMTFESRDYQPGDLYFYAVDSNNILKGHHNDDADKPFETPPTPKDMESPAPPKENA